MASKTNKKIVLIVGRPCVGKSYSLKDLKDPKSVAYFGADCKELPFKAKFAVNKDITDPNVLLDYIDACEEKPSIKTIVIDTITNLMKTFKVVTIDTASDTRAA